MPPYLVSDNVGDCAGSMADVFESIAGEMIGTMILGASLAVESGMDESGQLGFMMFPLVVHTLDLIVSGVGISIVKAGQNDEPLAAMKRGYMVTMLLAAGGFLVTTRLLLYSEKAPREWFHFFLCGVVGVLVSYAIISITQYYTDYACA